MTSIELFIEELKELKLIREDLKTTLSLIIGKYKEMHKQEIENAYWDGGQDIPMSEKSCEQYYQETFVSKGSGDTLKDYHIVDTNDIKKLIKQAHFDGQYLHSNLSKLLTNEMLDDNAEYYSNEIIQSLKLKT